MKSSTQNTLLNKQWWIFLSINKEFLMNLNPLLDNQFYLYLKISMIGKILQNYLKVGKESKISKEDSMIE